MENQNQDPKVSTNPVQPTPPPQPPHHNIPLAEPPPNLPVQPTPSTNPPVPPHGQAIVPSAPAGSPPPPPLPPPTPRQSFFGRFFHSKLVLIIPSALIILVIAFLASAYIVYGMGKTSLGENFQNDVWQNMLNNSVKDTQDIDFQFNYSDPGSYDFKPSNFPTVTDMFASPDEQKDFDQKYSFKISNVSFDANIKAYLNLSNEDKPQTDSHVDLSLTNNNKEFSGSADARLTELQGYGKYDYNENLKHILDSTIGGEADPGKGKWIQITNDDQIDSLRKSIKSVIDDSGNKDSIELLKQNRLFDIQRLEGVTIMDGHTVAHYSLKLNKDKLRNYVNASIDKEKINDAKQKQESKEVANALIDKIEVKDYQVWVGLSNHKLYKSSLTLNAVSVTETLKDIENGLKKLGSTKPPTAETSITRDTKRVMDARNISSAVELYFDEHNSYPTAQNGQPVGVVEEGFISKLPTPIQPADGSCTDYYNVFWYTQVSPTSYKIEFCLGSDTAGFKAGEVALTEKGISPESKSTQTSSSVSAPTGDITKSEEEMTKTIIDIIKNLKFDAEIKINYNFSNVGKVRPIEIPKGSMKDIDLERKN